jgi:crossover junction endodeoxyribonuclease RuvC
MKILGIDPGLNRVGFGMLLQEPESSQGRKKLIAGPWGIISTTKDKAIGARLQEIQKDLTELLDALRPDVISLERMFFFRNATTIIPVAQARGVILLVINSFNIPVYEYTPMQVKQAVTGSGKSKKAEIQELLIPLLNLDKKPTPDDAADALALALCHFNHNPISFI